MATQVDSAAVVSIGTSHREVCHGEFSLAGVQRGSFDKLGNRILEILWLSPDYAIYRTQPGVFIHFSDNKAKAAEQRTAFTTICPELCELRYLTSGMHGTHLRTPSFIRKLFFRGSTDDQGHSLFDHNIAQSLMLLMEGKEKDAKAIATAALDMAVARTTNDNTIRYLRAALVCAIGISAPLGLLYGLLNHRVIQGVPVEDSLFLIAGLFGIVGAIFSIITRIQDFEMRPCEQSNMNYWMALARIMIGLIGGFALYLLVTSEIGKALVNPSRVPGWHGAALIGFLGGFTERMVQSMFRRTALEIQGKTGTPVQLARGPEPEGLRTHPAAKSASVGG